MAENHVLLERVRLTGNTSTVTFDNLPTSGYTDLRLMMNLRKTDSNTLSSTYLTFNGSSANYGSIRLYGNGGGGASDTNPTGTSSAYIGSSNSATSSSKFFSATEVYIPNYRSSIAKVFWSEMIQEDEVSAGYQFIIGNRWNDTSAITSISITGDGNFVEDSTFALYGIAKFGTTPATAPFAEGGNIISTDGTYWYHTFTSSGVFTPLKNLTCDYVVVAGGGGGGGAGSGAGGLKTSIGGTALSLTSGINYGVAIGAGGTGASACYGTPTYAPTPGTNSVFHSITATGGGRGGTAAGAEGATGTSTAYLSGGSGGGACYNSGTSNYGLGTSGEGNNGGQDLFGSPPYSSAGGGGAGAVGQNSQSDSVCGAGGVGVYNAITNGAQVGQLSGGNYYLAGGGGGGIYGLAGSGTAGAGGLGGGGAGSNGSGGTTTGVDGLTNTGGGCGGSSASAVGRKGGSGVVIIRYSMV